MNDNEIQLGGRVGATIAFSMTFISLCLIDLLNNRSAEHGLFSLMMGLACFTVSALLMAAIGHLIGKSAAMYPTVNTAFLRGAKISGLICLALISSILLFLLFTDLPYPMKILYFFFLLTVLIMAFVSLLSGLTAIYVRDYRQTQRRRWIPRFTLLELMIAFTIVSVIISAMTSLALLR